MDKMLKKLERKLKSTKSRGEGYFSRINELKLEQVKNEKIKELEAQLEYNDLHEDDEVMNES